MSNVHRLNFVPKSTSTGTSYTSLDLWYIDLDVAADALSSFRQWLQDDELARAERIHSHLNRARYIVGRAALRCVLADRLACRPTAIRFSCGTNGKPILEGGRGHVEFKLAHSGGDAVIALADDAAIGVDIEILRPIAYVESLASLVFSDVERRELELAPDRVLAFLNGWTRKEAYVKALGLGLTAPLREITVSLSDRPALFATGLRNQAASNWRLLNVPHPRAVVAPCAWPISSTLRGRREVILKVAKDIAAACLTFALCCFPAFAQESLQPSQENPPAEPKFAWGVENDFRSSHVWRGLVISDQPVLQPEAWMSVSGFTLDSWSNLTLRDTTERTRPRIVEWSLQYDGEWKKLGIQPSVEADFYRDPLNVASSKWVESSLRVSYPAGPLRVFTAQSWEISDFRGAYFGEAGIDYEPRFSEKVKLEITPNIGWASAKFNDANIGVPKAAFNLVAVKSSLTYYVNKNMYLRPELGFSRIMDAELRAVALHPTFLTFGLAIGVGLPNAHRAP